MEPPRLNHLTRVVTGFGDQSFACGWNQDGKEMLEHYIVHRGHEPLLRQSRRALALIVTFLKVGGTENLSISAVNALAVNVLAVHTVF